MGGYFIFSSDTSTENGIPSEEQVGEDSVEMPIEGIVTAVDMDQVALDGPMLITINDTVGETHTIAVPSMGIRLCAAYDRILHASDAAVGDRVRVQGEIDENGHIVPCASADHSLMIMSTYTDDKLGYRFDYTKGPDGYVIVENEETLGANFISGIILFNRAEYEEFLNATDVREGPPAIHVQVYENTESLSPSVWVLRNPEVSNYELRMSEPREEVVGGANAVHFVADGLWPVVTYVVAHDGKIYLLMGTMPDGNDAMQMDFRALVDSFEFIRTAEQE